MLKIKFSKGGYGKILLQGTYKGASSSLLIYPAHEKQLLGTLNVVKKLEQEPILKVKFPHRMALETLIKYLSGMRDTMIANEVATNSNIHWKKEMEKAEDHFWKQYSDIVKEVEKDVDVNEFSKEEVEEGLVRIDEYKLLLQKRKEELEKPSEEGSKTEKSSSL